MSHFYEADFSGFGYKELGEAKNLIELYLDSDLNLGDIKIGFNANSGYVFIVDEDMNTYMDNGGKLEEYFQCSECGNEGFKEEIESYYEDKIDCRGCRWIVGKEDDDE